MIPPVWFSLLLRLFAVAVLGVFAGVWGGAVWGLSFVVMGLLLMVVGHTSYLSRLQRWLKSPEDVEVPEAWGAWGNIFVELYRMLRRGEKARARILAELELFRQACSALPDGVVFLDAQGHIVWCNSMAEQHLGINNERDTGLVLPYFIRQPGFATFFAQSESGSTFTYHPLHNPGMTLSLEVIPFEGNRKLAISFDITQIERADTIRRDFVANVSHELRTPLTVIGGFLEHLTSDESQDKIVGRQLALMNNQTHRMLRLVDDLLTLSRLEAADSLPFEDAVDPRELLTIALEEGRGLSHGRHTLSIEVGPAKLKAAREELRTAYSNLVSNAVRYTPEGGHIVLRWSVTEEGKGVLSVEDNGIGIAEEHVPRLTERFYRIDRGRSQETGGTGLGLAIVKHVLLRHQASLEINSQAGVGSTFSAVFPAWRVLQPEEPDLLESDSLEPGSLGSQ